MAADAIECCSLARRLALRLTDGMTAGTLSTTTPGGKSGETGLTTTAMVGGGAGERVLIGPVTLCTYLALSPCS